MTNFLYEIGEILGDAIFIDGTKIEACANKYTFVWKKAVSKNLERLLYKLADFVAECEELFGLKFVYENRVRIKPVKKLRQKLYALKTEKILNLYMDVVKRKLHFNVLLKNSREFLI
ncbi:hypothetical protein [Clostridium pasteurianum]|uniref:hypothetical protein n=1 Tax=Clostridium pasteurianum TaxID=1501 RepID=UPI00311957CA